MILKWDFSKCIYRITYSYKIHPDIKVGSITFRQAFDKNIKIMYPIKVEIITK